MEVLCEWGCNVNATDYKNNTGLHYLAKKQESNQPSAIYEYKLKRSAFGTRAEQKDYKKFARLYINAICHSQCGAKYNSVDAVLQLCKMGCNSSFVNRIGETAKSMAERLGNDLCKEAIDNYTGEYDTDSDEDDFFQ